MVSICRRFYKLFPVFLAFMGYCWDEKENVLLLGLFLLMAKDPLCVRQSLWWGQDFVLSVTLFIIRCDWSENTLAVFGSWSRFNQEAPESHSLLFSLNTTRGMEQCWEEGWWEMLPCSSLPSNLQSRVVVPGEWTVALKLRFSCPNTHI